MKREKEESFPYEEGFYRQVVETLNEGVVAQDEGGIIIYINEKFLDMFGYSREEVLGRPLEDFLGAGLLQKDNVPDSGKKSKEYHSLELAWKRKDGTNLFAVFSPTHIYDKKGGFKGKVTVLTDITERRKIEVRLRHSQEELHNLSQYIQSVKEKESERIAGEIHDELGQYMTALRMDLAWLSSHIDSVGEHKDRIVEKIEDMAKLLDNTIQTLQKISTELRPGLLEDLGLIPAIEWLTQDFQNRTGMECALQIQCRHIEFSPGFTTAIFRVAQEGLTNVARHSQATEVNIVFREREEDLELIIEDNGRGMTEHEISSPLSIGIIGMRERIRPYEGRLEIKGTSKEGTVLKISIPKSEAVGHD